MQGWALKGDESQQGLCSAPRCPTQHIWGAELCSCQSTSLAAHLLPGSVGTQEEDVLGWLPHLVTPLLPSLGLTPSHLG